MARLRERLTYANVTATLALVLALSGSAYATGLIGSADIADDSIRSKDIKNGNVKAADLASGPVQEIYETSESWTSLGDLPAGECAHQLVDPPSSVGIRPTDSLVVSADFLGEAYLQITPDLDAEEDLLFAYVCNNNPSIPLPFDVTVTYRVLR